MSEKPRLYIDVDGVLFGIYGGTSQLRPNAVQFLRWCVAHFDCYWLTAWPKARLDTLLSCLMAPDLHVIQEAKRTFGPDDKADAIDYSRSFYWIEDEIGKQNRTYLAARDVLGRYIYVHPEGVWELERVGGRLGVLIGVPYTGVLARTDRAVMTQPDRSGNFPDEIEYDPDDVEA